MFTKRKKITMSILASFAIMANAQANDIVKLNNVDIVEKNQVTQSIQKELVKIPGGTNLIDLDAVTTSKATLGEILKNEPGIMIQEFFGGNDQPRLNVRGSGIQSNPVNNGVNLLYDGSSINQADGSFVIGLLNPSQHSAVSVFRGANAMKYGSASLGGALNFTSKTGLNSDSFIEIQAGSHSTKNINLGLGGVNGDLDYYISAGYSKSDGFRAMSDSKRKDLAINLGYQVNDNIENRTLFNYSDNFFNIPFVLHKDIAAKHPSSIMGDGYSSSYKSPFPTASPLNAMFIAKGGWDGIFNMYKRKPHRDTKQLRIANKTTFNTSDNVEYQVSLYAEKLDDTFTDPLSHAIVKSKNAGINLVAKGDSSFFAEDLYEVSLNYNKGSMPIEYWVNNPDNGSKLFKFADLDQDADNLALNIQYNFPVSKSVELVADLQYMRNTREISGTASTPPVPGTFDTVVANIDNNYTYDALNPKLGLIIKTSDTSNVYANISRSMEAPTFNQLVNRKIIPLINATPTAPFTNAAFASGANTVNLKEQVATTFEVGTKGSWKDTSWQASYYYSKVSDELITQVDAAAVNGSTFNYTDKTTHQGLEFGLNQILTKGIFDSSDVLSSNIVYNYNNFTFDGGEYSGNQIAGVPKQTIYLELAYSLGNSFYIAPNVKIQPDNNYADHSNSVKQDSFTLYGLKLSYKPQANLTIYTNLNNLTDEVYESTYVVRGKSGPNSPTFLPGDGFNYTFGLKYTW